jgi:tRNA threonylcarbamoyl adenosine modification protein (Sua5/YciO/YrdC/YwlC family)
MPTDTVYGLAVDPAIGAGVRRLFESKGRDAERALPVLVASPDQARALATGVSQQVKRLMEAFWPGPLTLVLKVRRGAASRLNLTLGAEPIRTLALRQPDHPLALELLRLAGPLAVTSANVSGRAPATTSAQAEAQLGGLVACYLDAGSAPGGQASTIVDVTGSEPVVLRPGPIGVDRLTRVWSGDRGPDGSGAASDNRGGEI